MVPISRVPIPPSRTVHGVIQSLNGIIRDSQEEQVEGVNKNVQQNFMATMIQ